MSYHRFCTIIIDEGLKSKNLQITGLESKQFFLQGVNWKSLILQGVNMY